MNNKICIHSYITRCKSIPQPPGFADFLRGTISLYQYCKKYGYKFYVDYNVHPIFQYFQNNTHFLYNPLDCPMIEVLGYPYDKIDEILQQLFTRHNSNFYIITNAFYRNNLYDTKITNYGNLEDQDTKKFMRKLLQPTKYIHDKINHIFDNIYGIDQTKYCIIHIRFGDDYLYHQNNYDIHLVNTWCKKIYSIIDKKNNENFILITDSSIMGRQIAISVPELYYWDNQKNHMGDLRNGKDNIEDTVIDFFILCGAKHIYSNGSGFSSCVSTIFDIPYEYISF